MFMRTPQDCLIFHRPVGSRREPEIKVVLLAPITIVCEGASNASPAQHPRSQDAICSILLSHQPFLVRLSGLWVAAHPLEVIPSTKLIVWPQGSPQALKRLMYFSFTKRSRHRAIQTPDRRCRPTSVRKEVVDSVCFCCGNIPVSASSSWPSSSASQHSAGARVAHRIPAAPTRVRVMRLRVERIRQRPDGGTGICSRSCDACTIRPPC